MEPLSHPQNSTINAGISIDLKKMLALRVSVPHRAKRSLLSHNYLFSSSVEILHNAETNTCQLGCYVNALISLRNSLLLTGTSVPCAAAEYITPSCFSGFSGYLI